MGGELHAATLRFDHRKQTAFGLAAISVLCLVTILHGQAVATHPDALGGAWELASPSGVDGIFINIATYAQGPIDRQTVKSQMIQVRVYHRKNGSETWGWYVVSPPAGAAADFDGQHIRVGGLTATFDLNADRWTGKWSLDGQTREVVLERPRPAPAMTPNRLCGDWEGLPDAKWGLASTRLHIVQSSDGKLTAWMDRMLDVSDQRHGESLRIISADPSTILMELEPARGGQYRFTGALSDDGDRIAGQWNGLWNRLNAREKFRRLR